MQNCKPFTTKPFRTSCGARSDYARVRLRLPRRNNSVPYDDDCKTESNKTAHKGEVYTHMYTTSSNIAMPTRIF